MKYLMKKGIFLAGIISFMCFMGEAQEGTGCGDVRNSACSSVCPVNESDNIRINIAESVFFCKEACETTLKDRAGRSETCREICSDIFSRFYHEELVKEDGHDRDEKRYICSDIYHYSYNRKTCQKLPYSLIEAVEGIDEIMEDVEEEDLEKMDMDIVSTYIYISPEALEQKFERYSVSEARRFLFWLARPGACNRPMVDALFNTDKDLKILEELLKSGNLNPFEDTANKTYLSEFFDLINRGKNKKIGEWFHNFIKEECKQGNEPDKLCVLETYCSLDRLMSVLYPSPVSDQVTKKLVNFPYSANFINDVISEEVNKPNWSRQDFQSHKDLASWQDLCQ